MEATINFNHFGEARQQIDKILNPAIKAIRAKLEEERKRLPPVKKRRAWTDYQPPSFDQKHTEKDFEYYLESSVGSWSFHDEFPRMTEMFDAHSICINLQRRLHQCLHEATELKAVSITIFEEDLINLNRARTWI